MTATFGVRVRRGEREVEVHGPSEEFVREMFSELIDDYLASEPVGKAAGELDMPGDDVASVSLDGDRTFRELLNAAGNVSAAEKCVLAGYALYRQGQASFGREDVLGLFDQAMERHINFPREVKAAARRGFLMRPTGERNRYRLTATGLNRVRELTTEPKEAS